MATVTAPDAGTAETDSPDVERARVAIIGAGFSGLGMAIRLKQEGIDDYVILERADSVGGTWRDNTYPGCQCDIPSLLYSFSFAPNPGWTRLYPRQAEIEAYLKECARRFEITPRIRFGAEVQDSNWDDDAGVWRLRTARGNFEAQVLVSGAGGLSEPAAPEIPGLENFQGTTFHSAQWDHDHDLTGERVAVIGTGASAIQFVPQIQPRVGKLSLFQRTPPWVLPSQDRAFNGVESWMFRNVGLARRAARVALYFGHEISVLGTMKDRRLIRPLEAIGRWHLRARVADPQLRAKLTPDYTIGCKRILMSNTYYPALQAPGSEVVTDRIAEIRAGSIVTADGTERELDTIILATGFNVQRHPSFKRIRGRNGTTLDEAWDGSPRAYLGTAIAGFPNHFVIVGPNSAGGFNSIIFTAEAHINYVLHALRAMEERRLRSVEVKQDVYDEFVADVQRRLKGSVWNSGGCDSWYIDEHGGNNVWWPDFTWKLWQRTRGFDLDEYEVRAAA